MTRTPTEPATNVESSYSVLVCMCVCLIAREIITLDMIECAATQMNLQQQQQQKWPRYTPVTASLCKPDWAYGNVTSD